ncbi:MAG: RnfABCDGE type electron transport complex subunit D [Desulfobacteraceae bacterium]|nr:RnfABCDGE type electron transport complex subunit D [Desulfobacteraceae bacterium]MBC2753700.1 RnfABCDGE type electron transport complex subunit D [Desulfobacteraceae bacterium]
MTENSQTTTSEPSAAAPVIHVSPSPHLSNQALTTQRIMLDVVIGLLPVVLMALYVFRLYAVKQLAICVVSCLAAEALFTKMRGRSLPLKDCSALVTGVILALSLPGPAPWYVGFIASFVAIGIGKTIFGGVGMNLFNPAMVGRAFVMIAFASVLAAAGYQDAGSAVDAVTQATPMDTFKQTGVAAPLSALFFGLTNGSLGETSALACLIGGLFLCIRRTASWEIPAGVILAVAVFGGIANLINPDAAWTVLHHLLGGSLLFGAFFIATDPVSSPLTPKGKFIFGLGVGALIMLLRLFSGYPEGVMFAVLLMNGLTPLINRWTIPQPLGAQ